LIRGWRITKSRYAQKAFDGMGAYLYGGRWNNPGSRIVYVSESIALATLELLVNGISPHEANQFISIPIDIPEETVSVLDIHDLPADWKEDPVPASTKAIGDTWANDLASVVLQVPSAVVDTERNFLINPAHPDFSKLRVGSAKLYIFDDRLVGPIQ
jgi:RES domain-containing protein